MKTIYWLILAAGAVFAGCSKGEPKKSANSPSSSAGTSPLTAPTDYLGAIGKAKKSAEKTIDMTSLSRAIQAFHAMEDRYPKDLHELVDQHYLPTLPVAPPGMRFTYDANRGEVRMVRQ